jgi:hypothetical protein
VEGGSPLRLAGALIAAGASLTLLRKSSFSSQVSGLT